MSHGEQLTLFTKVYFSSHKNATKKKKTVYRMSGQIYSQSGSRVILLDAFLEWSFSLYPFLSLRCPLGSHPSPSNPPRPSPLFILYKYNQTGPCPTLAYILLLCLSVSLSLHHTYTYTTTKHTHRHTHKGSCRQSEGGFSKTQCFDTTLPYSCSNKHTLTFTTPGGNVSYK